jgi:hypothetical protein
MSEHAYEFGIEVYRGVLDKGSAIEQLSAGTGMNSASASYYVVNLGHMLAGEVYHRTLSFIATSYFLKNIRFDFGEDALNKALSALEKHLDYYDSLGHGRQMKLRKLLEKYRSSGSHCADTEKKSDATPLPSVEDLVRDLVAAPDKWLDTKNDQLGGEKPGDLAGTPKEPVLPDAISTGRFHESPRIMEESDANSYSD